MKRKYIIILVIVGIITIIGIIISCINLSDNTRMDKITSISYDNDITYIETSDGNIWTINGNNNIKGNTIIFDTLGTNTIYDDVIIDIK
ncbi:MAG: hypothetical protein ACI4VL_02325 [Bacilli bacterium]